ncbi:MAG: thioredoxin [Alphaproteobacteria bacterium]|nr:MAG: thioredoxin [Alphaproteobacteria bacterium]
MSTVSAVSDDSFDVDVLAAGKPVIVDFWAEWCGPCKQVSSHFEALAAELGDKVRVVKINIDDNPLTAGRFGVRGLPTFMIFQDGKVTATHLGAMSKTRMVEWLRESAPSLAS